MTDQSTQGVKRYLIEYKVVKGFVDPTAEAFTLGICAGGSSAIIATLIGSVSLS